MPVEGDDYVRLYIYNKQQHIRLVRYRQVTQR